MTDISRPLYPHPPGHQIRCLPKDFISSTAWMYDCYESNCLQYWKLLALDLGTYTESDINIGGGQEETIKAAIKEDFTRCAGGKMP